LGCHAEGLILTAWDLDCGGGRAACTGLLCLGSIGQGSEPGIATNADAHCYGGLLCTHLAAPESDVDVDGIHRVGDIETASTMIINVAGEDRRFISTPGANTRMTVKHLPIEWATRAKVLYLGGYLMLPGLETEEMLQLLRAARASGTQTVLDVVYTGDNPFERIALLLPETDVFLPNDDEARLLTGLDDPLDQAAKFRDAGAGTVVITQGEAGTLLVSDDARLHCGVYPTDFVGGTGAGDAFDAGYIAGLLLGEDPAGCLRWGSALGASCVRSIGATESVFNRQEATAFMQKHILEIETF